MAQPKYSPHISCSPTRRKMALIWIDLSGSLLLLRSFNVTLGTSLFFCPSIMPSSNQPVTTSTGSSAATASTEEPQP